jgi:hypothetical protein
MAGKIENGPTANGKLDLRLEALLNAVGDTDAIPKGTMDPLYGAKARVFEPCSEYFLEKEQFGNGTKDNPKRKRLEWVGTDGICSSLSVLGEASDDKWPIVTSLICTLNLRHSLQSAVPLLHPSMTIAYMGKPRSYAHR